MYYAAKYLGKLEKLPTRPDGRAARTGRFWGVMGRKNLPHQTEIIDISELEEKCLLFCVARRFAKTRARRDVKRIEFECDDDAAQDAAWWRSVEQTAANYLAWYLSDPKTIPRTFIGSDIFDEAKSLARLIEARAGPFENSCVSESSPLSLFPADPF